MTLNHFASRVGTLSLGAFLLAALAGTSPSAQAQITGNPNPTPNPAPGPRGPITGTQTPTNNTTGTTGAIVTPGVIVDPTIITGNGTGLIAPGNGVGAAAPGVRTGVAGNPNAPTSVPTGRLTGRPIRVRRAPTQPAGTQRLLNNSNLPIFTGVVKSTPNSKTGFQLLVGKYVVRVKSARATPAGLSVGDLVQVQGLRTGNNVRAGSISILRDR